MRFKGDEASSFDYLFINYIFLNLTFCEISGGWNDFFKEQIKFMEISFLNIAKRYLDVDKCSIIMNCPVKLTPGATSVKNTEERTFESNSCQSRFDQFFYLIPLQQHIKSKRQTSIEINPFAGIRTCHLSKFLVLFVSNCCSKVF